MKIWITVLFLSLSSLAAWSSTNSTASCTSAICDICFSPQELCDDKLIALFDSAKESLDIAIYNLSMRDIGRAIVRAQTRGVRVRLIADYKSSLMRTSIVESLKREGVPVKLWNGENNLEGLMHHKFSIVDGRMMQTGSYNYSRSATIRNAENQIYMSDREAITKFQNEFDRLWTQLP